MKKGIPIAPPCRKRFSTLFFLLFALFLFSEPSSAWAAPAAEGDGKREGEGEGETSCPVIPPERSIRFPHGQNGPVLLNGTKALFGSSWSRGWGVLLFDLSGDVIRCTGGIPAKGYIMSAASAGDTAYFTSTFSFLVAGYPEGNSPDPAFYRNILTAFPTPNTRKIAADPEGKHLFLLSSDGLRILDLSDPHAPLFSSFHPEFREATDFAISGGGRIFYTTPDTPGEIKAALFSGDGKLTRLPPARSGEGTVSLLSAGTEGLLFKDGRSGKLNFLSTVKGKMEEGGNSDAVSVDPSTLVRHVSDFLPEAVHLKANGRICLLARDMKTRKRNLLFTTLGDIRDKGFSGDHVKILEFPENCDYTPKYADFNQSRMIFLNTRTGELTLGDISGKKHLQILSTLPVIFSEGAVVAAGDMVYSQNPAYGTVLLYGFPLQKESGEGKKKEGAEAKTETENYGMTFFMEPQPDRFDTGIVTPATAMMNFNDRYLLANGMLLDISDPRSPKPVRNLEASAADLDFNSRSGRLYFAAGKRVTVEDLSRIPEVKRLGEYRPPESPGKRTHIIAAEASEDDKTLSILNGNRTLEILNVSDPGNIRRISGFSLPSDCLSFTSQGSFLYLPCTQPGAPGYSAFSLLLILDISDPAAPKLARTISRFLPGQVAAIRAENGKLYASARTGISEFDLSDPLSPVLLRRYGTENQNSSCLFFDIRNGKLFAKRYGEIQIWELLK